MTTVFLFKYVFSLLFLSLFCVGCSHTLIDQMHHMSPTEFKAVLDRADYYEVCNTCDDERNSILHIAVKEGKIEYVKLILETDSAELLINRRNASLQAPLIIAVLNNDYNIAEDLLTKGAHQDSMDGLYGRTALAIAVFRDKYDMAKLLLEHGANVNWSIPLAYFPLYSPSNDLLSLLLANKASPNATLNGKTLLFYAVCSRNLDAVEILLKYGADVNKRNYRTNMTAIFAAIASGRIEILKTLIKNNADLTVKNSDGDDPVSYAKKFEGQEIFDIISSNYPGRKANSTENSSGADIGVGTHLVPDGEDKPTSEGKPKLEK